MKKQVLGGVLKGACMILLAAMQVYAQRAESVFLQPELEEHAPWCAGRSGYATVDSDPDPRLCGTQDPAAFDIPYNAWHANPDIHAPGLLCRMQVVPQGSAGSYRLALRFRGFSKYQGPDTELLRVRVIAARAVPDTLSSVTLLAGQPRAEGDGPLGWLMYYTIAEAGTFTCDGRDTVFCEVVWPGTSQLLLDCVYVEPVHAR